MSLLENWLPPTRQHWSLIVSGFQLFPLFTITQWLTDFHPMGKTSIDSRFNLPGKWAWCLMELVGPSTVLWCMRTIPRHLGTELNWQSWLMPGLYIVHYSYRAVISPLILNPSISPIHPIVFLSAVTFNVINGLSLGGWFAGYGSTATTLDTWTIVGMLIWALGLAGNIFHDEILSEIRRSALRKKEKEFQKLYLLPQGGLFEYVLYPHYLCEWLEWFGFYMAAGWSCTPARAFLLNEIATMTPRAVAGRRWYVAKFGADRVGQRYAVLPGLL